LRRRGLVRTGLLLMASLVNDLRELPFLGVVGVDDLRALLP
jgi:hypothetical protein